MLFIAGVTFPGARNGPTGLPPKYVEIQATNASMTTFAMRCAGCSHVSIRNILLGMETLCDQDMCREASGFRFSLGMPAADSLFYSSSSCPASLLCVGPASGGCSWITSKKGSPRASTTVGTTDQDFSDRRCCIVAALRVGVKHEMGGGSPPPCKTRCNYERRSNLVASGFVVPHSEVLSP